MGFIKFLRRVNRGIVLAIVMLIGLSGYLTVDSLAFKDEREAIKQVLENYAEDMANMVLLPEQYREIGVSAPDSVIEEKNKKNKELVGKYFMNSTTGYSWNWNIRDSVTSNLEEMHTYNQETGNKIKSYDAALNRIKNVTKHGSSLVTVEVIFNLSTTATQSAQIFRFFYNDGGYYHYEKIGSEEPAEMTFSTQKTEMTFSCEMTKKDGVWKISNHEGGMSWRPLQ